MVNNGDFSGCFDCGSIPPGENGRDCRDINVMVATGVLKDRHSVRARIRRKVVKTNYGDFGRLPQLILMRLHCPLDICP